MCDMATGMTNRPAEGPAAASWDSRGAWALLMMLGAALAVVGWTDVALLWYPARWASVDWEFGTISGVVDGLPLGTIGLGLVTAAAIARSRRRWLLTLGIVELIVALLLLLMLVIYVLDVPVVLRAVDPQLKDTVKKAIVKTGWMAVVYVILYLTIGISAVRRVRATSKGVQGS
jgi:hypothetical protein